MRRLVLSTILVTMAVTASAEIAFSGLDLSGSNQLLFEASTTAPEWGGYSTLFTADIAAAGDASRTTARVAGGDTLSDVPIVQLTHFPEVLSYLPELGAL